MIVFRAAILSQQPVLPQSFAILEPKLHRLHIWKTRHDKLSINLPTPAAASLLEDNEQGS